MATVPQALELLGIRKFILTGEPTNEQEFNNAFQKIVSKDDNNEPIYSSDPKDFGFAWKDIENKLEEITNNAPMEELRAQRNLLLAETDWTALNDVNMSDKMKKYRQDLRDITKDARVTIEDGELKGVTFPTKPTD